MSEAVLDTARRGRAQVITLANPGRRNALGLDVLRALEESVADAAAQSDVAAIVIANDGPAFSSGHDLSEMTCRDPEYYEELFGACVDLMTGLHDTPQPVIAQIDGVATAAGCQLVAASDLAVATDRSTFATPGVRIGLFCSTPMVPLTRSIGRKQALEMLLTGEPIDARTAREWGLVNRVVAPDELVAEVDGLVDQVARFSPTILAMGKKAFYDQIEETERDAYAMMHGVMAANAAHPDAQEGIAAFLDKRRPTWGGS